MNSRFFAAPRGYKRVGDSKSSIELSLEGGLFAEVWPKDWLRTRIEAREAFTHTVRSNCAQAAV